MPAGLIVQPSYHTRRGVPVIQLFGRLESGEPFLVEESRFRPYFFAPRRAATLLVRHTGVELEPCALRDLRGTEVVRVALRSPRDVPALREALARDGVPVFEADIRFVYRFLIDRGIRASLEIVGEAERLPSGLLRYENPELRPCEARVPLRSLAIDLETSRGADAIYAAALVGDGADEVHLVAGSPVAGAQTHPDERALLEAVAERVRALDPDILTGWNVVDFDLRVWQQRSEARRADAQLGRLEGPITFQQDPGFTRDWRATLPGRMVLDGMTLVRDAVRLEDYRLETAARTLLGRGKLIDGDTPDAAAEIERLYRDEPEHLAAYNREDARLVAEILAREELLDLAVERSLLCGMQLDRVGASIASFDLLYLPELRRRGFVAPGVDRERSSQPVTGGALLDPRPGLYRNIGVYDFRSLYPSLIRTFNLDPLARARSGAEDDVEAPNGARFSRRETILPEIIERFLERRAEARRRGARHADQAIKIMMNALFGVLGASGCRFFDPEIANAITGFGQQTLRWTRDAFEEEGVTVLYGDTDSVFVQLDAGAADDAVRRAGADLRERVQERIAGRVRLEYGVEPRLELELERIYERFFLPRVRRGSSGSKKRYAGWREDRLELVGLEAVRRDWPAVAKRLQEGLLREIFRDRDPVPFARSLVERLRAGELDAELVYAKRLRKGSLDRYTATSPPHVQAARKAGGRTGPVVRYVIAHGGPEPVLPGRPLPDGIDRRHYLEHVLRPVADAILPHVGQSFDDALDLPHQLPLL